MRGGKRELAKDVSGETLLSVLLLDGLVPVDRGELEHASMRPAGQQAEQVAQVAPGLDRVKLAACEQRDEGRVDLACVVAADEEPVAAAHNLTPELKFAPIIVNRQPPVLEKALQCPALVAGVSDGGGDGRFVERAGGLGVAPSEERIDDGPRFGIADVVSFLWQLGRDGALDSKQPPDEGERLASALGLRAQRLPPVTTRMPSS